MAVLVNEKKNKPQASHLALNLLVFLGNDKIARDTRAQHIINSLVRYAQEDLQAELVGEYAQVNARISDYDALRAAGKSHSEALAIEAEKAKKLAELAALGLDIRKGKEILKGTLKVA